MKTPRLLSKIAALFGSKKSKSGARKTGQKPPRARVSVDSAITPATAKRAAAKRARQAAKVSRKSR